MGADLKWYIIIISCFMHIKTLRHTAKTIILFNSVDQSIIWCGYVFVQCTKYYSIQTHSTTTRQHNTFWWGVIDFHTVVF